VETGKVRVAYLNFPLTQHRNALPAAIAAMCASAQGRFWEIAGRLFETQDRWKDVGEPRAFFDSVAARVVPDAAAQRACVESRRVEGLIEADKVRSERAGAVSTPTFFIGSRMLAGARPLAAFRQALNEALAAAGSMDK
jgi:protein-disulfide isomerase